MFRFKEVLLAVLTMTLLLQFGAAAALAQEVGMSDWQSGNGVQSTQPSQSVWQGGNGGQSSSQMGQSNWQSAGGTQFSQPSQSGWQGGNGGQSASQLGQSDWQSASGTQSSQLSQSGWQGGNGQSASRAPLVGGVMQQEKSSPRMSDWQQSGSASNTINANADAGQNNQMMSGASNCSQYQSCNNANSSNSGMNSASAASYGTADPTPPGGSSVANSVPNMATMLGQLAPVMGAIMQAMPTGPMVGMGFPGYGFPTYGMPGRVVEIRRPGIPHFTGPGNLTPSRGFRSYH